MFDQFGLPRDLERGIATLGFDSPTPVQEKAIPPALAGRDVVACAMTGTGKTAAFLLPIASRLIAKPGRGTRALVLTPTRELAAQVAEHLRQIARHTRVRGAAIYGGVAMGPQRDALRRGTEVVIATPGRLIDHLQSGNARLDGVEILVLDEADRMLDMGFLPAIRQILRHLPRERQTLLFSATMPAAILSLARELMTDPVSVDLGRKSAPADGVKQAVYPIAEERKKSLLVTLLAQAGVQSALVFTRTKHRADRLARFLEQNGVPCAALHGNRTQSQRTRALDGFRSGAVRVLVATDIAARGIDVEALSHVVNFDLPNAAEDYIHRVGRTGRAQAVGDAWTFVAPGDEAGLRQIERAIGGRLVRSALPELAACEGGDRPPVPGRPAPAARHHAPPARHGTPAHYHATPARHDAPSAERGARRVAQRAIVRTEEPSAARPAGRFAKPARFRPRPGSARGEVRRNPA